ncbi:unnamed protein product [Periconia digitata]|uniref:Peptidase S59 domain-containing protein n=1 Tax=Periconia digitata TaxID=1303443 RepID=A0A9W4XS24_9PLEO|nr:unnamed protein product [Periconia digitata]
MSFAFGNSGGFGSNNNNQSSGFGGFGSSNNNTSGFGSNSNSGSIFGQSNNGGGSAFGTSNTSNSGFGGGGFGANNNTTTSFGSKPFGSTGNNMFGGSGGNSSTFGGFGASSNSSTTPAFGGGSNSGGLFGQNKPAFGASTTNTGSSLFGGGNNTNTGGGFGTNTSTGFGASNTGGGFGANNANAPAANNGTGSTPFQAIQEKEAGTANNNVQYQTITFQPPYQNFSLEELRTVDYNQGRRYGNSNGQAGAFGQSTGFGGFGASNNTTATTGGFGSTANNNTGGGLFGGNSNTSFGQNSNASTGFGANTNNTSGGLFGSANKPAGGSVFGSTPATNNTGGGLFGNTANNNNNTGGGFGATNNTGGFGASNNTGGGLFGGNNNANNQNKPAGFGGFGANNNTGGGFGANNNAGGSTLFGASTNNNATPGFGANNQAAGAGSSLFGNSTGGFGQNQQNQQAGGGLFGGGGGGGFGQNAQNNQQKPGGLFGNSTGAATGGGLFGNSNNNQQQQQQQQQPATGGLFGNKPATGGGLFGNSSTPATGGGLFGQSNNAGATGGGLFGNAGAQNNQQAPGGGLFGNANNQQKPGGGLFGNSTGANNTSSGLFGQSNQGNNQLGGSLFGGQNQAQQNQQPMNNSLFGASGGSLLQTSMNTNPYGNDALFSGLGTPSQSPGPLATPLSSSQKNRKSAILPQHKLNPSQSTRLLTPQGKRNGGYGFSYSTYGTPTGSSQNSPLNGSIFSSGNLSRSLGKSLSTSNLRNGFTPDTSILAPGAFSATGRSFGSGSLKKLNINRTINMRPSLFDEPQTADASSSSTKRVSFAGPSGDDAPATNGTLTNGSPKGSSPTGSSGALVLHQDENATENRTSTSPRPEMQQVNGNELATVPGNSALTPRTTSSLNIQNGKVVDPKPGHYYSEPSMETLKSMSKDELKSVSNFVVGRDKIGKVEFNMGNPVNLSEIDLDQIFGEIVEFKPRHVAVYGPKFRGQKPELRAPGLNKPSRITLGNSWPKSASQAGKNDPAHVHRLKRINNSGTDFESFDPETGIWIFSVPHFSTYGLDYEEYEESSPLSAVPETPDQLGTSQMSATPENDSTASASQSSPDDTFDFKKGMRQRAVVPGQFGSDVAYEQEEDVNEGQSDSFLGERSVGSLDGQEDYTEESESDSTEDQEMADSVSGPVRTTEQSTADATDPFKESAKPKSILKASQLLRPMGTPSKGPLVFDDDWANTLQRTISPKKQDRKALRESQGDVLRERDNNVQPKASVAGGRSDKLTMDRMDLMDSLFGETDKRKDSTMKRVGQGIQLPYAKRPKTSSDLHEMAESDKEFHSCNKPHFSENGVLVYAGKHLNPPTNDLYAYPQEPIAGAGNDIRFKRLPTFPDGDPPTLNLQKEYTKVSLIEGVPKAHPPTQPTQIDFERIAEVVDLSTVAGEQEHKVWQLLHILFDQMPEPVDVEDYNMDADRWRKEQLSTFWKSLVLGDAEKQARGSDLTPEEKAIAYLSGNSVPDACHTLIQSHDLRLATMIAQIGDDDTMRQDMIAQIEDWRRMDVLPEIDDSKRALYELISGNCAKSEGKTGGGRENKASSFIISSRFNLDWRRAFGLRLWYGTKVDEPIELAVAQYADALRDGKEDVKPVPWFIEQGTDMGWADEHKDTREDLLWGILKLYASSKMDVPANVEDVLAPENVSGHPLNARLSFQLFNIFKARVEDPQESEERIVGMPMVRDGDDHNSSFLSTTSATTDQDDQTEDAMVELGDKLALTYAASLHTPKHWVTAVWVYTHLSQGATREHYIRSLLAQFSNTFSLTDSDATFTKLLELSVPATWAHAAAALQAKTEGDALRQAMHLIKADELEEAHEVLCRSVGPESIISRDYDALRELLGGFVPTPPNSPNSDSGSGRRRQKEPVQGWSYGGQIYFDYIELLDLTDQRSGFRENQDLNHQITYLLGKLSKALEIVARDRLASVGLEERVALTEIASLVADEIAKNKMPDRSRVLKLPLTEDKWLKHTIDLSVDYYRNVVADAVR